MLTQRVSSGEPLLSVYATVSLPADQLHYSSVTFQEDSASVSTDRNTDKTVSSACDYSTIKTHSLAEEQTL